MTNKLSPAAQAVMDAANGASSWGPDDCLNDAREIAAAALRAAADQMVTHHSKKFLFCIADSMKLLAIVTKLEAR